MRYQSGRRVGGAALLAALIFPIGLAVAWAMDRTGPELPVQQATPDLPAAKQTVLGLYVTARDAYEKWQADPLKIKILDVRTLEEFLFVGHPPMAWNVPVMVQSYQWDAAAKRYPMQPNPDFVAQVKAVVSPADTLLIACRSGGRSAMAVNLLAKAGFTHVFNIVDGMEGDFVTDPDSVFVGLHMKNGWKLSGLPWTYDIDPGKVTRNKLR